MRRKWVSGNISPIHCAQVGMDNDKTLAILRLLSDGNDPETGKPFPPDSPYQRPDVIRALFHAVRVLESGAAIGQTSAAADPKQIERPGRTLPGNAGKPWSKEEDGRLTNGFDSGASIEELAAVHGRSRIAIEARLAKFGKVPMPAGVRGMGTQRASDSARTSYTVQV